MKFLISRKRARTLIWTTPILAFMFFFGMLLVMAADDPHPSSSTRLLVLTGIGSGGIFYGICLVAPAALLSLSWKLYQRERSLFSAIGMLFHGSISLLSLLAVITIPSTILVFLVTHYCCFIEPST